jgi:hypothetical protein
MPAPLAALAALVVSAAPAKVAVLPVAAGEGIPPSTAAALTESLSGEVRHRAGVEVITEREIAAVLSLERQKTMLGCTSEACMAELGGALGCDRLVTGDLARLGESWLVHLRLVETARARVVAQADRRLRGGTIDDVLDQLPAMVAELFPGATPAVSAAAPVPPHPAPASVAPPRGPAAPSVAEEPVEVPPRERHRLAGWADGQGHLLVIEPFVPEAPLWWGDGQKLFRVRLRGGGQEGQVAMSRSFWDPRARRGAEAEFEVREGRATLTCGDQTIPLRRVLPRELLRRLATTTFLAPRWRRLPLALARDDQGTYYYVDGARGADGAALSARPDQRLWIGHKGHLVRAEITQVLADDGLLVVAAAGRLEVRPDGHGGTVASWIEAAGRRALTWLDPSDHGPLIYGELGVYAGEALGTPCDGRL